MENDFSVSFTVNEKVKPETTTCTIKKGKKVVATSSVTRYHSDKHDVEAATAYAFFKAMDGAPELTWKDKASMVLTAPVVKML